MNFSYLVRWTAIMLLCFSSMSVRAFFNDDEARLSIKNLNTDLQNYQATQAQRIQALTDKIEQLKTVQQKQYIDVATKNDASVEIQRKLVGDLEHLEKKTDDQNSAIKTIVSEFQTELKSLQQKIQDPVQSFEVEGGIVKSTVEEIKLYRFGVEQFNASEFGLAANALKTFTALYPESMLLPNAYYWLGSSYYALGDCKNSIRMQSIVFERFPATGKSADALLNRATCHQELNELVNAKHTLNLLIEKYPNANAAVTAKQRLKSL